MGVKYFGIMFDNPVKTYAPGDILSGKIILDLDSPEKCRGLKIKMKGEAETYWRRPTGNGSTIVRGHEEYFSLKYYIVGGESEEVKLDAGEHIYSFERILPANLPSSYEAKFHNGSIKAHIRYTVEAVIDRPWKFDPETKAAFTVISPYDLNTEPGASKPVMVEGSKTFGVLSDSPPLYMSMSLPVRGYVPGQTIPIKIHINNQSGLGIYDVELKLEKHVKYLGNPRSWEKKHNMSILKVNEGKIQSDVVNLEHFFEVPVLPPSRLGDCNIIQIEYALELEACVDKVLSTNLKMAIPILIGTVPLIRGHSSEAPSIDQKHPSGPSASAPPDYYMVANQLGRDYNLPPPSYEESIFKSDDFKEEDDSNYASGEKKCFAPKYPYFHNFPLPQ